MTFFLSEKSQRSFKQLGVTVVSLCNPHDLSSLQFHVDIFIYTQVFFTRSYFTQVCRTTLGNQPAQLSQPINTVYLIFVMLHSH